MQQMITDRNVLVTGGAGSIGRELVSRFLSDGAEVVRLFDNNEPSLSRAKSEFDEGRCRFLLGDIRDKDRLERAMRDVDIVVHAAAMKHVNISEYNPFEAVKTNVVGLQNVVDTAIDTGVDRVVFTSSDKSADPANTMGTTKLLGEKLITAGNKYSGRSDLRFASVRFGNVIGSSQSVIPVFKKQIRDGGPVTLTDRRMTRFFLTKQQMTDLVTDAIRLTQSGEVFVHKMSAMRIEELAKVLIDEVAPQYGYDPDEIDIEIIGRRTGETLHEKSMTELEANKSLQNGHLYAIPPETGENGYLDYEPIDGFEPCENIVRSSANAEFLDAEEIRELLADGGVLGTNV